MAQDWMKVELHTPFKPRLLAMAVILKIDRWAMLGRWTDFWAWADRNSANGRLPDGFNAEAIDAMLGCPGFTDAAVTVRWLNRDEDGGLSIPNFKKHNGSNAKKRALNARRQDRFRSRERNADVTRSASPRPDQTRPERREEKNSGLAGSGSAAWGAGLAGCLAEHGVGEPARSILARTSLTPERVKSIAADIRADAKVADPVAVLVGRLKLETGATIPRSERGRIKAEDAKLNGTMLAMREQSRRNHAH